MPKYKFVGEATVSCFTVVEAESLEVAMEEAKERSLADLCHNPFVDYEDSSWHFENNGEPREVLLDYVE